MAWLTRKGRVAKGCRICGGPSRRGGRICRQCYKPGMGKKAKRPAWGIVEPFGGV